MNDKTIDYGIDNDKTKVYNNGVYITNYSSRSILWKKLTSKAIHAAL